MRWLWVLTLLATPSLAAAQNYFFFMADRLEYVAEPDHWLWDMQGWYGGDEHKFWWKSEGDFDSDGVEEADLQLLYSRAISAYWDIQFGIRQDIEPSPSTNYAVIGFQGLAPQWFEVDVAAFVSEDGDLSARFEAEYDLLLTQKLVLQPRVELDTGPESFAFDLRLRYEIRREIAPYIGVSWQDRKGEEDFVSLVAGARFWF